MLNTVTAMNRIWLLRWIIIKFYGGYAFIKTQINQMDLWNTIRRLGYKYSLYFSLSRLVR